MDFNLLSHKYLFNMTSYNYKYVLITSKQELSIASFSLNNPTLNDNISCARYSQSTNVIPEEPKEECTVNMPKFYLIPHLTDYKKCLIFTVLNI